MTNSTKFEKKCQPETILSMQGHLYVKNRPIWKGKEHTESLQNIPEIDRPSHLNPISHTSFV